MNSRLSISHVLGGVTAQGVVWKKWPKGVFCTLQAAVSTSAHSKSNTKWGSLRSCVILGRDVSPNSTELEL